MGRDQPVLESICKPRPVGLLPAGSGPIVMGGGGAYPDPDGRVVGTRRWEGRCIPGAKSREPMWVGESQVDGARSVGSGEGEPSINARGVEKGKV